MVQFKGNVLRSVCKLWSSIKSSVKLLSQHTLRTSPTTAQNTCTMYLSYSTLSICSPYYIILLNSQRCITDDQAHTCDITHYNKSNVESDLLTMI